MRFRTRVRHGAKHLDKLMPGWARKVRLRDLELRNPFYAGKGTCGCILAQLDAITRRDGFPGTYVHGAHEILGVEITDDSIEAEGFTITGSTNETWSELTDLWKDEIRARR